MSSPVHFDISAQEQTYAAFIKASIVGTVALVTLLSLMAYFLI